MATNSQYNFTVTRLDLEFILKQIKIAEASTTPDGQIANLPALVGSPLLPFGLRTVDGTWNSLLPGMERLGAADNIMPRLVAANLQDADMSPAAFGPSVQTSYTQTSGLVFDSQPRTASNLIVDQTANNPAAVAAALQLAGYDSAGILAEASVIAGLNVPVQQAKVQIQSAQAAILAAGTDAVALAAAEQQLTDAKAAHATAFQALTAELELAGLAVADNGTIFVQNLSPDIGLSPSFNGWMTFFGQFFDHGLDLLTKGGNGTVFVPLMPDDPLYVEGSSTNFMVLTRATQVDGPGADGIMGTADDTTHESINTTTPFIDQNQTYTSHPSHQVFLREYVMVDGKPQATGHLLDGAHGLGNWAEVKAQARDLLGIHLTDMDVHNVPLLATDRYGEFLRGANGFVQIVTVSGLVEGDPAANGGQGVFLPPDTIRTDHAFLNDIAHGAAPGFVDHDNNPATPRIALTADSDTVVGSLPNPDFDPSLPVGPNNLPVLPQEAGTYDNELLDRHFITGDGRGNENIGLTTVHAMFHSEHNRLVEDYKQTILGSGDLAFINEWLLSPVNVVPTDPAGLIWDGERLFQAGRFVTEMQYQHLAFEEFARAVQPSIDPFIFTNSPDIDPAIVAEFAHVVYRFGHSMLTESVDRLDINMQSSDVGLITAFLNPLEFDKNGLLTPEEASGAIIRGMTRQVGNEIDEFVTDALRNNLVGLPLDLATINMTRARDTGMPSFNEARAAFFAASGDSQLEPFSSWADLAPELKNVGSIINFIAAYGTHSSLLAATTLEGKRDAAMTLVFGGVDAPPDRLDFLNSTGGWTAANSGLNDIDFWIGGLAERKNEFGGMLGATFNYVFENQMENLQNGDRFYYLSRTQGTNMLNELENNTFSKLVMRNTDLGSANSSHVSSLLFQTANYILELNQSTQIGPDPVTDNPILQILHPMVIRLAPGADVDGDGQGDGGFLQFTGGEHVVLGGTAGNDTLRGGNGIDTLWGDAGNDRLDGGNEADQVHGGDGDDIITDLGTPAGGADFLHGDEGNDVISSGMGNDLVFGGGGNDFIVTGDDFTEVFASRGDDFVLGGNGSDVLMGNEGDDWIEGGEGFDGMSGENSELFFNSPIIGHDVLNGQGNDTDYDGESGDDIMVQGPGIQRSNGMFGFDWAIHKDDLIGADSDLGIPFFPAQAQFTLRDRFDSVEGLSGWNHNDILTGAAVLRGAAGGAGAGPGNPVDESDLKSQNISLINGYAELLGLTPAQVAAMPSNTSVIDITQGAEVIIGGGGNDTIKGNLGNDLLDGDAWLNVRISVLNAVPTAANPDPGEWFTVDSMNALTTRMLTGEINPGQLKIVREILQSATAATDIDTAVYNGNRAEYTIVLNSDGSRTITHTPVVGGGGGGALVDDGIDTIRNFEYLQFADQLLPLINVPPVITSDGGGDTATRAVDENTLLVTTVTATDANEGAVLTYAISGGADAAHFAIDANTGELSFVTAPNFEVPTDADGNNIYDVIVEVSDGTAVDTQALAVSVQNANDATTGTLRIGVTTATNTTASLGAISTLADEDVPALVPAYQWQQLVGGIWVNIAGATTATLSNQSNTTVRLTASYSDPFGSYSVVSDETASIGDGLNNTLTGTATQNLLLGLGGSDTLTGGTGNDTLDGGAGNDILTGGAGDDTVAGGVGNDTLRAGLNDGNDVYIGGAGTDTYDLSLTSAAANVNLTTGVGVSAETGTDTLVTIENVRGSTGDNIITDAVGANTLIGNAGNDTFVLLGDDARDVIQGGVGVDTADYSAMTANLSVNMAAGTAVVNGTGSTAGLSDTVNGVENFIGGTGNDTISGNGAANQLSGGVGNDTLSGLAGLDTLNGGDGDDTLAGGTGADTLTGELGADVFDYNATNESGVGAAARDVVTDFLSGTDKLDFSTIDANTALLAFGNQAFSFNATAGAVFTGAAQLVYHYEVIGGQEYTVIEGNVNANLGTDFQVALIGHQTLAATDLVL
ncbi:peroxidase family protein [Polaromonas sp.]|jgi:Ca2+-binding RTX toxin-like protein|uniref:peroxidase family protein n=1 Tax=Polaromonas sp. TaxID=1869339 RepID=UPI0037CAE0B3